MSFCYSPVSFFPADETRLTFFHECPDALGVIGRQACASLRIALKVELGVERIRVRCIKRALDQCQALCWRGCKMLAKPLRLAGECRVVHAFPDKAPLLGLLGGQWLGQESKPARTGVTDKSGKKPGAPGIRYKPDAGK